MSEKIVTLNEEVIKGQIRELVRGSVEETLNELLEAEAEKLTQAARYERVQFATAGIDHPCQKYVAIVSCYASVFKTAIDGGRVDHLG